MQFSTSSDDEALERELARNQRQRNRRRERDAANVVSLGGAGGGGGEGGADNAMPHRVLVGDGWVEVRVGTLYHVVKGTYVSILEAQRHTARYFGDPNRRVRLRAFRDPSSVFLRCAIACADAATLAPARAGAGVRTLPRVKLSEASVRSFYLALDDDDGEDEAPCGSTHGCNRNVFPLTTLPGGLTMTRKVPTHATVHPMAPRQLTPVYPHCSSSTCPVAAASNQFSAAHSPIVRLTMRCDTAAVAVADLLVGGCIAMGTIVGADGGPRLGILTPTQLVFAHHLIPQEVRWPSGSATTTGANATGGSMQCATLYPRAASDGVFAKDVALLVFSKQSTTEYLFQREHDGVATQLRRRARGSTVPDAMSVCGWHDAVGSNPVEALVVHGAMATILSVVEMRARMLELPNNSQTTAIASTERNALGSGTHMIIGGTRRRDLFCLVDDPRTAPQRAFRILSPAIHAVQDAASSKSGVQAVVMQGDFGFLSIETNGHCKLWDLRALGASLSTDSARPVFDFNSVQHRMSEGVDVGCSYAVWGSHVAVSNSVGRAKVFCRRTGQLLQVVEHGALGRSAAMGLLPPAQSHLADSCLLWCDGDALCCASLLS